MQPTANETAYCATQQNRDDAKAAELCAAPTCGSAAHSSTSLQLPACCSAVRLTRMLPTTQLVREYWDPFGLVLVIDGCKEFEDSAVTGTSYTSDCQCHMGHARDD